MTIYLDIVLVENMLMNYIILFATVAITKKQNKHQQIKIILSSLIGSIYAIIVYLDILPIYSNTVCKIILSIIMVYIVFLPNSLKELIKRVLTFYLVSFVFGGCTIALMYLIKPENIILKNGVFVGTYPIKAAILSGIIAFTITQIVFKINKSKLTAKDMIYQVEIINNKKTVIVNALLDTGNMLKDPISGFPVIIVEEDKVKQIISNEFLIYIHNILGGDEKNINNNNSEYISKIRMIPFKSLGKKNGMLVGIRVDKIKIEYEQEKQEIKNVIVGIYNQKLTKENKYNALIGLNLLEKESNSNELITNF